MNTKNLVRKTIWTSSLLALLVTGACGKDKKKDDDGDEGSEPAATAPVGNGQPSTPAADAPAKNPTDVTSNLKRADAALAAGLPKFDIAAGALAISGLGLAPLSDLWTAPDMIELPNSDHVISDVRNYMGDVLDPEKHQGPIASYRNTTYIFCVISQYLTDVDASGLPKDGDYDVHINSEDAPVKENCTGGKDEGKGFEGDGHVVVTSTSDDAVFTKKYVMDEGDPSKGFVILVKTGEDGTFNLAGGEVQDFYANRLMLMMDPVTKTLTLEGAAQTYPGSDDDAYLFYRALIDLDSGASTLIGYDEHRGSSFQYIAASAGPGKDVALSLSFEGQHGGDALGDYSACVDGATGSIKEDATLACSDSSVPAISSVSVIQATRAARTSVDDYRLEESVKLPFATVADMIAEIF